MKKLFSTMIGIVLATIVLAQSPQAFKYQAVIRNNQGKVLVSQLVSLQISILQDSPMGDVVYMETHQVATNDYGIANITIGEGEVVIGVFADIPWGTNTHFVKTELDITGNRNYEFIGTSQLLSVPYALYAERAGVSDNASDDFDKDPSNELQVLSLDGNILTLSNGNTIDLSKYLDNTDNQELLLEGNRLTISGGNTVVIDANNTDELQVLQFFNDTLYLSDVNDYGKVYLGAYKDNTDNQTLSIVGNKLVISGGNSVQFDTDSTNEIQAISFSNDTLYLSNGGKVYLGAYRDNTDNQTLSIVGNELVISGGNSVVLSGNMDLDADPINELQVLSYGNDTIYLSQGNYIVLPHNNDNDTTNELQFLSKKGSLVTLSTDGGSIELNDDDPQNEIQKISFDNGEIILDKNGGRISLNDYIQELCLNEVEKVKKTLEKSGIVVNEDGNGIDSLGCLYKGYYSVNATDKVCFGCADIERSSIEGKYIYTYNDIVDTTYRELTTSEMSYILNGRKNANSLHFWATINGSFGLVLLPDNLTNLSGITYGVDGYNKNIISDTYWLSLQALGAVFLPSVFSDINPSQTGSYNAQCGCYPGYGSTSKYVYYSLNGGSLKTGINTSFHAISVNTFSFTISNVTRTESLEVSSQQAGLPMQFVKSYK